MATATARRAEPAWLPYVQIARISHWVKNVFVLPGLVVALSLERHQWSTLRPFIVALGLLAVCLIASSNYVLNEILDAASDKHHPVKALRPIPSGRVDAPHLRPPGPRRALAGRPTQLLRPLPSRQSS